MAQVIIFGLVVGIILVAYWLLTDKDDNLHEAARESRIPKTQRSCEASPIRPRSLSIAASRPMLKS